MAMSAKQAPTEALVIACELAIAMGGRVSEMPPWDAPNAGAHSAKSWHYDRDGKYGQAADINFGASGTSSLEREKIIKLIRSAESLGLGVIYARDGVVGSAGQHRTHLHMDVGSYSNLGTGSRRAKIGSVVPTRTQVALNFTGEGKDNLFGQNSQRRLDAVRCASKRHGVLFPYGITFAQAAVGAPQTGVWDAASRKAHDRTVRALQDAWNDVPRFYTGTDDYIWGPLMDKAGAAFLSTFGR